MSNKYFISPFFPASFGTQPPENGFEIQRKTEDGEWELLAYIEDPDADFFEDDDVIEETTYTYRVRRFVSREPEEWSNETSVYVYYGRAAVSSVPSAFLHIGPAPVSIKTARASKIIPGALEIQVIPLLPRARTAIVSSVRPDSAVVQVAMQAPGIKTARKARADAPAAIIKAQFLPPQTMSQRGIKTTLPASIVLARALLPYIRSTANTVLQVPQAVIDISSLAPSAGVADAIHTTVDGPDIRPEVVAAVHLKNDPESLSKVSGENLTSANDGLRIAPSIRLFHGDNEIIDSDGKIPWSVLKGNPSITAGTGLTGGGALTDSRSLSIDFAAADASSGVGVSSQVARLDHHHDSRYLRISPTGSQTIFYPNANTSTILRMSSGAVASPFVIQDSSESPVFSVNTDGAITQGSIAWSRITSKPSIVNSISAGTGISVSGSGSVTISNSDRGSSQNIFKKIRDTSNNDQFAASSNDDYIQFGASGIASVSFSPSDKRVTYSASLSAGTNISVSGSQISTVNNPTFSTSVTTPLVTNAGALTIRTTGSNNLILSTDSSERMRITGAGDVGIGTTSPSHKLDISGTARVSGALTLGTQATGTEHAVRADRTITIAGTSNQINVSAGAQNLTANRTWTLSLPQDIHTGASPTFRRVISSTGYAFRDTRDVNDSPADKMNGNMSLDFKDRSAVGNPPASASAHGTYAHIVTLAGWPNQSGGRPTQLSTGASGIAVRQASSDSAWGPWWSAVMESPSGNVSWSGELTSGSVPAARVTGILDAARIPNLNASKITAGTLAVARLPRATTVQAEAGTSNSYVMTPLRTKEAINALGAPKDHQHSGQGDNSIALGLQASAEGNYSTALGFNAIASGTSSTALGRWAIASGTSSTALGDNASAVDSSTALGDNARAWGYYSTALGNSASAEGNYSTALGYLAIASGMYSTALGDNAIVEGDYSTALGRQVYTSNARQGVLGGQASYSTNNWIVPGSFTVSGSKNFEIPHPHPDKRHTHMLRHGAVESPTAGDTLYRFTVTASADNETVILELPDYFQYLNVNVDIWVNGQGHFGNGYGWVEGDTLYVTCELAGKYKVLVIGTRNDDHQSIQDWHIKGVEREVGESWTGETWAFDVEEIMEIEEIKEAKL